MKLSEGIEYLSFGFSVKLTGLKCEQSHIDTIVEYPFRIVSDGRQEIVSHPHENTLIKPE